jgi:hypothetical protein
MESAGFSRSVAVYGEVHVVLGRARPGPAPGPPNRRERPYDLRSDHPLPETAAVKVRAPVRIPGHAAADVGVLTGVQVDGMPIRVIRPVPRSAATRAGRGHRLSALERGGDVEILRIRGLAEVEIVEAHVADGKAQRVELTKDADEWFRDVAVDDELSYVWPTIEADVREREKPQVPPLHRAARPPGTEGEKRALIRREGPDRRVEGSRRHSAHRGCERAEEESCHG